MGEPLLSSVVSAGAGTGAASALPFNEKCLCVSAVKSSPSFCGDIRRLHRGGC